MEEGSNVKMNVELKEIPFVIDVVGTADIPHPAERGCFNLNIANEGLVKATVVEEVIATAKRIEALLSELSPADDSTEAKEEAPLAHWDKTSLSSTSHVPHRQDRDDVPRQYRAELKYDIRFRDFRALGRFGTTVSSFPYVEIAAINWTLTANTQKSFKSTLRQMATQDALEKARDYCKALGCTTLRPVELSAGEPTSSANPYHARGGRIRQTARKASSAFGSFRSMMPGPAGSQPDISNETAGDLEFRPQEIKMSMDVSIKFHAQPSDIKVDNEQ